MLSLLFFLSREISPLAATDPPPTASTEEAFEYKATLTPDEAIGKITDLEVHSEDFKLRIDGKDEDEKGFGLINGKFTSKDWSLSFKGEKIPVADDKTFVLAVPLEKEGTVVDLIAVSPTGKAERQRFHISVPGWQPVTRDVPTKHNWEIRVLTGYSRASAVESNTLGVTRTDESLLPTLAGEASYWQTKSPRTKPWKFGAYFSLVHVLNVASPISTSIPFPLITWSIGARVSKQNLWIIGGDWRLTPYLALERAGSAQVALSLVPLLSELVPTFQALNIWSIWGILGMSLQKRVFQREFEVSLSFMRSIVAGATVADATTSYVLGGWSGKLTLRGDIIYKLFATINVQYQTFTGGETLAGTTYGLDLGWKF